LQLAVGDRQGAVRGERCAERGAAQQFADERGTGAIRLFHKRVDAVHLEAKAASVEFDESATPVGVGVWPAIDEEPRAFTAWTNERRAAEPMSENGHAVGMRD
jgi:hypothetical protein